MVMVVTMIVVNKKNFFIIIIFGLIFYNSLYAGAKIQKNYAQNWDATSFCFCHSTAVGNIF